MPRNPTIPRVCENCGKPFLTWPYLVAKGFGKYCSSRCSRAQQPVPVPPERPLIPHPTDPTALLVPLTQGKFATIDAADAEMVAGRLWQAREKRGRWYAQSAETVDGKRTIVEMHVLIFGEHDGETVDHWDGDGLHNRRRNLRSASHVENSRNQRRRSNNLSGFKGVGWHPSSGTWMARIKVAGRQRLIGYFHDPEEAARAYDDAARAEFGAFARLNFPREGEQQA